MSRSRRPRRYIVAWKHGKDVERGRVRARERSAVQRGDEMPSRDTPWMRWDRWSHD